MRFRMGDGRGHRKGGAIPIESHWKPTPVREKVRFGMGNGHEYTYGGTILDESQ